MGTLSNSPEYYGETIKRMEGWAVLQKGGDVAVSNRVVREGFSDKALFEPSPILGNG